MIYLYAPRRPFKLNSSYPKKEYLRPHLDLNDRQKNTLHKMHKTLKTAVNDAREFLIHGHRANFKFYRFIEDLIYFINGFDEFDKLFKIDGRFKKSAKTIKRAQAKLNKFKRLKKNGVEIESMIFENPDHLKYFKAVYFLAQCLAVDFDDFLIAQSIKERGQSAALQGFEEFAFLQFEHENDINLCWMADVLNELTNMLKNLSIQPV